MGLDSLKTCRVEVEDKWRSVAGLRGLNEEGFDGSNRPPRAVRSGAASALPLPASSAFLRKLQFGKSFGSLDGSDAVSMKLRLFFAGSRLSNTFLRAKWPPRVAPLPLTTEAFVVVE